MTIVADSSPLIFLGKIRQLPLIPALFGESPLIPASVRDEVMAPPIAPAESRALRAFLAKCRIVNVARPVCFSTAMSRADNDALTLAIRRRAARLLADDRLLRDMAAVERIRPVGTVGILLLAMRNRLLTAEETRLHLDALVSEHRFRIGIALYKAVLAGIAEGR